MKRAQFYITKEQTNYLKRMSRGLCDGRNSMGVVVRSLIEYAMFNNMTPKNLKQFSDEHDRDNSNIINLDINNSSDKKLINIPRDIVDNVTDSKELELDNVESKPIKSVKREKKLTKYELAAIDIYEYYKVNVRPGSATDAKRNIANVLKKKEHDKDDLIRYVDNYIDSDNYNEEIGYRKQANNFFGRSAEYESYIEGPLDYNGVIKRNKLSPAERKQRETRHKDDIERQERESRRQKAIEDSSNPESQAKVKDMLSKLNKKIGG